MKHTPWMAAAAISATSLLLAACGTSSSSAPSSSTSSPSSSAASTSSAAAAGKFLGCMVTDTGGINDKSFNQSAWQGMQEAAAANPNITVKYLQSTIAERLRAEHQLVHRARSAGSSSRSAS